jgi:hypothetical protein
VSMEPAAMLAENSHEGIASTTKVSCKCTK